MSVDVIDLVSPSLGPQERELAHSVVDWAVGSNYVSRETAEVLHRAIENSGGVEQDAMQRLSNLLGLARKRSWPNLRREFYVFQRNNFRYGDLVRLFDPPPALGRISDFSIPEAVLMATEFLRGDSGVPLSVNDLRVSGFLFDRQFVGCAHDLYEDAVARGARSVAFEVLDGRLRVLDDSKNEPGFQTIFSPPLTPQVETPLGDRIASPALDLHDWLRRALLLSRNAWFLSESLYVDWMTQAENGALGSSFDQDSFYLEHIRYVDLLMERFGDLCRGMDAAELESAKNLRDAVSRKLALPFQALAGLYADHSRYDVQEIRSGVVRFLRTRLNSLDALPQLASFYNGRRWRVGGQYVRTIVRPPGGMIPVSLLENFEEIVSRFVAEALHNQAQEGERRGRGSGYSISRGELLVVLSFIPSDTGGTIVIKDLVNAKDSRGYEYPEVHERLIRTSDLHVGKSVTSRVRWRTPLSETVYDFNPLGYPPRRLALANEDYETDQAGRIFKRGGIYAACFRRCMGRSEGNERAADEMAERVGFLADSLPQVTQFHTGVSGDLEGGFIDAAIESFAADSAVGLGAGQFTAR